MPPEYLDTSVRVSGLDLTREAWDNIDHFAAAPAVARFSRQLPLVGIDSALHASLRRLRYIPSGGQTVEVTARTIQGRLLLKPVPEGRIRVLGVLGRALERHPTIRLHAFVFLSNHFHLLLTTPDSRELAEFMCFLKSNVARELGHLFAWREKFWGRRYVAIPVLDDVAMVDRLSYLFEQGCKENLVASPLAWPGASSVASMVNGDPLEGIWFDRTAEFRARRAGRPSDPMTTATRYEIRLQPLPCWSALSEAEHRARCAEMVAAVERSVVERMNETGRRPAGEAFVLAQDPHDPPLHSSRSPAPLCHASDRDRWGFFKSLYENFVELYKALSRQIRAGALEMLSKLPAGCFPPPLPWRELDSSRQAVCASP